MIALACANQHGSTDTKAWWSRSRAKAAAKKPEFPK